MFIIVDILNDAEGVIKNDVILRGNMPFGGVQDQSDVTGMSRTIPKEYAVPRLFLPAGGGFQLFYIFLSRTYTGQHQTCNVRSLLRVKIVPLKKSSGETLEAEGIWLYRYAG